MPRAAVRNAKRHAAAYVSPRLIPEKMLREAAEKAVRRNLGDAESAMAATRLSGGYQRAIKSKLELEYVHACGSISGDNTLLYNIYRVARSSLSKAERGKLIERIVEKETMPCNNKAGRKLEDGETGFISKVWEFLSDVRESNGPKERDLKMQERMNAMLRQGEAQAVPVVARVAPQVATARFAGLARDEFLMTSATGVFAMFGVDPHARETLYRAHMKDLPMIAEGNLGLAARVSVSYTAVNSRTSKPDAAINRTAERKAAPTAYGTGQQTGIGRSVWVMRARAVAASVAVAMSSFFLFGGTNHEGMEKARPSTEPAAIVSVEDKAWHQLDLQQSGMFMANPPAVWQGAAFTRPGGTRLHSDL